MGSYPCPFNPRGFVSANTMPMSLGATKTSLSVPPLSLVRLGLHAMRVVLQALVDRGGIETPKVDNHGGEVAIVPRDTT